MDQGMTCYVHKCTRVLHTLHIKYVCNYLKKKMKEKKNRNKPFMVRKLIEEKLNK